MAPLEEKIKVQAADTDDKKTSPWSPCGVETGKPEFTVPSPSIPPQLQSSSQGLTDY